MMRGNGKTKYHGFSPEGTPEFDAELRDFQGIAPKPKGKTPPPPHPIKKQSKLPPPPPPMKRNTSIESKLNSIKIIEHFKFEPPTDAPENSLGDEMAGVHPSNQSRVKKAIGGDQAIANNKMPFKGKTAAKRIKGAFRGRDNAPDKMAKKSQPFESKLEGKLSEYKCDIPDVSLGYLLQQATSPNKFDSSRALKSHLTEGALLNVNSLASSYLGIPGGEYMVYRINTNKAVLVPVSTDSDLVESGERVEILTPTLCQHWDKLERCLSEIAPPTQGSKAMVQKQHSKYPRNRQLRGAIEAAGASQEEIAASLGVDPSTVSRWTIDHDSGGRKPSLDHAVALSKKTGQDVQSLFGNVIEPDAATPSKRRKATSGSGGGRNPTYQGE